MKTINDWGEGGVWGRVWDGMGAWGKIIPCGGDFMEVINIYIERKGGSAAPPLWFHKKSAACGMSSLKAVRIRYILANLYAGAECNGAYLCKKKVARHASV